ncbi:hypothetical protein BZA77DRAFT_385299 [Pyronema omphalodes]|nr:hypothetical protein BZA77DRAFT_385299 [Pyronema omphalodes]
MTTMDPLSILLGTGIGAIGAILGFTIWMVISRRRASRNPSKLDLWHSVEEGRCGRYGRYGRYNHRAWTGSEKQHLKSSYGTPKTPRTPRTLETSTRIPQCAFPDNQTPPPTPPGPSIGPPGPEIDLPTIPPQVQTTNFFRSSTSTCATEDNCYSANTQESILAQKSTPYCSASVSPLTTRENTPSIVASVIATAGSGGASMGSMGSLGSMGSMKSTKSIKSIASLASAASISPLRTRPHITIPPRNPRSRIPLNPTTTPKPTITTPIPATTRFQYKPSISHPLDRYIKSDMNAHLGRPIDTPLRPIDTPLRPIDTPLRPIDTWSDTSTSDYDFAAKYSSTIFPDVEGWEMGEDTGVGRPESAVIPQMGMGMERVYVRR